MDQLRTRLTERRVDTKTGEFSGYGAVFENLDSHGDRISRGAFAKTLAAWKGRGRLPHMRLMHADSGNIWDDLPIGIWTEMREDGHGLFVRGKLLALDTDYGRRLLSLMDAGALDGLSIGYSVIQKTAGSGPTKRWLDELRLFEISVVDDPSNGEARVTPLSASDAAFDRFREAVGGLKLDAGTEGPVDRLRAALQRLGDEQ
ncbi:MAG: HK97 family phage prohead protease [Methylobacterium sp.]|nr:HK97 family phage prohead protease [Methylobacterium sp.]